MVSISTIAGSSGIQQQNIKKTDAKLLQAIASLVSGKRTDDVANLAIATQLQSQVSGLKQVSQSIAQASSLTQVADGALSQSQEIVDRMKEIAIQSRNGATSDADRVALNKEFQQLSKELDRQVASTQFNGKNVLDGSVSGENALSLNNLLATDGEDNKLEIDDLSTEKLFDGKSLSVLTSQSAGDALEALNTASGKIAAARADVGSFQQTLNFSAASIDSAITNQEAARSLLSDADFLEAVSDSEQAKVQRNAQLSLIAQGNRLPKNLLDLLN